MTEASGKRAAFVLVHGAWHGGWCMKDQPCETFRQPVKAPAPVLSGLRRAYLLSSSRPHYLAAAERAQAQGFTLLQLPGAGHDVIVTQPKELAAALCAFP